MRVQDFSYDSFAAGEWSCVSSNFVTIYYLEIEYRARNYFHFIVVDFQS